MVRGIRFCRTVHESKTHCHARITNVFAGQWFVFKRVLFSHGLVYSDWLNVQNVWYQSCTSCHCLLHARDLLLQLSLVCISTSPSSPHNFHSPQLVFIDSGLPTRSSSHCHLLKLPKLHVLSTLCSHLACLLEMQHSYTMHYWQLVEISSPEILVMDQWKCFQGWYWSLCSMVGVFYFRALSLVVSHMILVSGFFLLTQIVLNTTHASVCQDGMDSDTLLP